MKNMTKEKYYYVVSFRKGREQLSLWVEADNILEIVELLNEEHWNYAFTNVYRELIKENNKIEMSEEKKQQLSELDEIRLERFTGWFIAAYKTGDINPDLYLQGMKNAIVIIEWKTNKNN